MSGSVFGEPTWAIVELFGHNLVAGLVAEVQVAGVMMLRVDVPAVNEEAVYTKFYGGQAIYAITPTDKAGAVHAAAYLRQAPVSRWKIGLSLGSPAGSAVQVAGGEDAGEMVGCDGQRLD